MADGMVGLDLASVLPSFGGYNVVDSPSVAVAGDKAASPFLDQRWGR